MKAKRTIACVAALAMLASSAVSFSASAANAVTLKVGEATAQASESFTVDVSVKDVPATKINVLDFALSYDSSALTIESVKLGPAGDTASGDSTASEAPILSSKITTNAVNISWSTGLDSASWIAEEGVVFTITGTVNADAADGKYPIQIQPIDRETYPGSGEKNSKVLVGYVYGTDSATYEVNAEDGFVEVTSKGETTTTTTTTVTTDPEQPGTSTTTTTSTTAKPGSDTNLPNPDVLYGDVNVDGKVSLVDAVMLNKAVADVVTLGDAARANADCNVDKEINGTDAIILLQFLSHIIDELPYSE
ncbi:cohesin domain-containing protein [uncultured Ruminococcus sp.]|uniref:cohesin domain-containing protein n=1 Tax=uncultured Ruminococcus sp. TaxID=165186 RepID=UPI0025F6585F|nr:cohesin domain-containing protein [uncultured Ruminococcus sp.]